MSKRFRLGEFVCTDGAANVLADSGQLPSDFLDRHLRCDWGGISDEERSQNEAGLEAGGPLRSVYKTLKAEVIWITTAADRSTTTLHLPGEA